RRARAELLARPDRRRRALPRGGARDPAHPPGRPPPHGERAPRPDPDEAARAPRLLGPQLRHAHAAGRPARAPDLRVHARLLLRDVISPGRSGGSWRAAATPS